MHSDRRRIIPQTPFRNSSERPKNSRAETAQISDQLQHELNFGFDQFFLRRLQMRVNKKAVAMTLVAAAVAAGSAQAAEKGFYVGGSIGQTSVSIDDVDFHESDTGWK